MSVSTDEGLRLRRRQTIDYINMPKNLKQDTRAQQRTFEGAYIRTAVGQLSFALVIVKLFNPKFAPIGIVFTVYSVLLIAVALIRRTRVSHIFLYDHSDDDDESLFYTSGTTVLLLSTITILSYSALIALLWTIV